MFDMFDTRMRCWSCAVYTEKLDVPPLCLTWGENYETAKAGQGCCVQEQALVVSCLPLLYCSVLVAPNEQQHLS